MQLSDTSRRIRNTAIAALFACGTAATLLAQPPQNPRPQVGIHAAGPAPRVGPRQNQEHLAQWMDRHSSLPLLDQQTALQNEPGFRQLPSQTQQRMMDRLTQLNNMPDEKRRRILERTEVLEHLSQPQRQQVRSAMQELGSLPVDRRRLVARAFRDLRDTPPQQRQSILSSDRIRGQFSDQERATLNNLLNVEPYLPVQRTADGTEAGR